MELLFIWLMFPVVAAVIANAKGRSGFGWFLLGLLLGIFAVLIVACLPNLKAQAFVMTPNADGTATMVRPATQREPLDLRAAILAPVVVFGLVVVVGLGKQAVDRWDLADMRADRLAALHAPSDADVDRVLEQLKLRAHPALVELRARQASQE